MTQSRTPDDDALDVVLLSDGIAGHDGRIRGAVRALRRLTACRPRVLDVVRRGLVPRFVVRRLIARGSAATALKLSSGLAPSLLGSPDLIVASGSASRAPLLASGMLSNAPTLYLGPDPNSDGARTPVQEPQPTVHITPFGTTRVAEAVRDDGGCPDKRLLPPNGIDPASIAALRRPLGGTRTLALLLGGPRRSIRYTPVDWARLGALMLALAEDGATRFIVVTSRRTPREATDALREVITDRRVVRQFIEHGLARGSGIEPVLSLADAVLMTVDSPSMLTEAIAARRAVITLAPSDTQLDENDVAFRAFLEGEGWMRALPLGLATPETIDAALTEIIPQTDDCVGALAQHLRQVLLPRLRR